MDRESVLHMLHLGCGPVVNDRFLNVDIFSLDPRVRVHDIRSGLPFADETFDLVYHSHVLEHMERAEARRLLAECFRVLRAGGLLRVVVPDLETSAARYLEALTRAQTYGTDDLLDHEYATIDLIDQLARHRSGGEKQCFWHVNEGKFTPFVLAQLPPEGEGGKGSPGRRSHGLTALLRAGPTGRVLTLAWRKARLRVARVIVGLIAGRWAARAFDEGVFRNSGEVHKWMYDRLTLMRELRSAGFGEIRHMNAFTSSCPAFPCERMDQIEGRVRKPGSLFMEAIRPMFETKAK